VTTCADGATREGCNAHTGPRAATRATQQANACALPIAHRSGSRAAVAASGVKGQSLQRDCGVLRAITRVAGSPALWWRRARRPRRAQTCIARKNGTLAFALPATRTLTLALRRRHQPSRADARRCNRPRGGVRIEATWTAMAEDDHRAGADADCRCHEPAATSSAETSGTVASALGRRPAQAAVPAAPLVRRRCGSLARRVARREIRFAAGQSCERLRSYVDGLGRTAIASIETSRPRGSRTWAGADRAGGGSGMGRA